ncbi:MAG TPA: helix-turn-helix transcriptional regulator [Nakamurella sp.]
MRHGEPDVRGYAVTHPAGRLVLPQAVGWDQLIFASRGVMTAHTDGDRWTIPRHRALWVPSGIRHRLDVVANTSLRTLYLRAGLRALPPHCRIVNVTPLLHELILHTVGTAPLWLADERHAHLVAVLLDQLAALPPDAALVLPMPTDPRCLAIAQQLQQDVGADVPVSALCQQNCIGRRTLERLYLAETGLTFGQWRRRLRMLEAIRRLGIGDSVATTAHLVGYATPSAFSAAFRAELGVPPLHYSRAVGPSAYHPDHA